MHPAAREGAIPAYLRRRSANAGAKLDTVSFLLRVRAGGGRGENFEGGQGTTSRERYVKRGREN